MRLTWPSVGSPDEVGGHLANLPNVAYRRLSEVVDSAESDKEGKYDREHTPNIY